MPLILAIESSTPRASLALLRDSTVIFESGFESDRNHNSMLFEPLQQAIAALDGAALEAVVIGTGPGSYSGTRVGIAAGQGVAMVHGCPAVGLSSLLATGISSGVAIGDARRGSAWWADVRPGEVPQPEMLATAELAGKIAGSAPVFSFEETQSLGLPAELAVQKCWPTAVHLAEAWRVMPDEVKRELATLPPQPAYLRPPHITEAKKGHPLLRSGKI
ncbi:tRNA (adenosine(37)-N6)-threonylcarbamoyltransferase complex dimerization subunit type 1 TsaB [Haloferula chungangensis]|uniref:tRNA (Adenosine(37)-N6)-threonylcarbamoyltransferase complex dimerization subunit type 1 TsaB n=1 Tax=Haloferula chungangensis TaxID=1048331 RepID=A0ABW2LEB5_9BACT